MPPLRRHPALVPLSRDHHNGLMLVLKIKKGIQYGVSPDRMAPYIKYLFDADLKPHFEEEENGVFEWLDKNHPLRLKALDEHREIEQLLTRIDEDPANLSLQQLFIQYLDAHIRFEERVLFPHLQEHFPDQLEALAIHTPARPSCHLDASWPDHFWLAQK